MTSRDADRAEFDRLLAGLCEADSSANELARLEQLFIQDPAIQSHYFCYMQVRAIAERRTWPGEGAAVGAIESSAGQAQSAGKAQSAGHAQLDLPARDSLPASGTGFPGLQFLGAAIQWPVAWMASPKVLALAVVGGMATYFFGLMISIAITRGWNEARHPLDSAESALEARARTDGGAAALGAQVGSLSTDRQARWSRNLPAAEEKAVRVGQRFALASGRAEVLLVRGTRIVVEGPAVWQLASDQRLWLELGKLVAYVPKSALGFAVETPTALVVDLGTEFGVEVDAHGETGVEVFQGTVDFAATGPDKSHSAEARRVVRRLEAGQAAQTAGAAKEIVATDFPPGRFARQLKPQKATRTEVRADLERATATHSSQFGTEAFSAEKAIDGDMKTLSHTMLTDPASWWRLDLGRERPLTAIVLHNDLTQRGWLRDITITFLAGDGKTVVVRSPVLNQKNHRGEGELNFDVGPTRLWFDFPRDQGKPPVGRFLLVEREPCAIPDDQMITKNRNWIWYVGSRNTLVLGEVEVYELSSASQPAKAIDEQSVDSKSKN